MNDCLGALNDAAITAWETVTAIPLASADDRTSTMVISANEPNLLQVVGSAYRKGIRVLIVSPEGLDSSTSNTLTDAGFSVDIQDGGYIYRGPAPRPISQYTEIALAGPVAARLYAGAPGATSATVADLALRHRHILIDDSLDTQWFIDVIGDQPQLWQSISVTDRSRMVQPLLPDGRRPVLIHRTTPHPLLVVGDTDLTSLDTYRATLPLDPGMCSTALIRGSGPLDDAVATIRNARENLWQQVKQSSGLIAPRSLFRSELDRASVIIDAASKGVPVLSDHPGGVSRYLGPALHSLLATVSPAAFQDVIYRDEIGVQMHRAVNADMRHAASSNGFSAATPNVTVVVPTIRPHLVTQALDQIERQRYDRKEVVVAVHGEIDHSLRVEWENSVTFPMTVMSVDPDKPLGYLYNQAVAAGSGEVITIMDDDDFYGKHHIVDLVDALAVSQAQMVGKGAEFFHLEGIDLTIQRSPEGRYGYTNFIGGSTLTIRRQTLAEIGGFRPITLGVDGATIKLIERMGGRVYRAHGYGYLVGRRATGHTWDPGDQYFVAASVRQMKGIERVASGVDTETG